MNNVAKMSNTIQRNGVMIMSSKNTITMEHGAGGESMQKLIRDLILDNITNKKAGTIGLENLDDGATIDISNISCDGAEIVVTTDSYVIKPIFFPGADIGRLAISGTVNDLAMMGATPLAITCAIVMPEGFKIDDLEKIIKSMNFAAKEVGVPIITGDTKTIERNGLDSIIINTTGIGLANNIISDSGLQLGDKIIVTGTIGDHGTSLMAHREGFNFDTDLISDVAPLWNMIKTILSIRTSNDKPALTAMKDPTRGGLANALNEMIQKSNAKIVTGIGVGSINGTVTKTMTEVETGAGTEDISKVGIGIMLDEDAIPIKRSVVSACEMLGLDPLEIANEGKAVMGVKAECTEKVLTALRGHKYGVDAAIIGEVIADNYGKVLIRTSFLGTRYVDIPTGDPIPRVC